MVVRNHRLRVAGVMALCGLIYEISRKSGSEDFGSERSCRVALTYCSKVSTGQRMPLSGYLAKKALASSFGDPLFRGLIKVNVMPSGSILQCLRFSFAREETRSGQDNANSIASFNVSCFRESVWFSPTVERNLVTVDTSQVWEYLGLGGRMFSIPFKSCVTRGCWPTR